MSARDPATMVANIYRLVSGRREEERDWRAVRALLAPAARLRSIRHEPGGTVARDLDREGWIAAAAARFRTTDFFEIGVVTEELADGSIATLVSPFATSTIRGGEPFEVGVNHFSFVLEPQGWSIVQILWSTWAASDPAAAALRARLDASLQNLEGARACSALRRYAPPQR